MCVCVCVCACVRVLLHKYICDDNFDHTVYVMYLMQAQER